RTAGSSRTVRSYRCSRRPRLTTPRSCSRTPQASRRHSVRTQFAPADAREHLRCPGGRASMNWEVFVTCAVTGAGDTSSRSEQVPVTPEEIADSAIEAARAGAAVVHIHVRDPE